MQSAANLQAIGLDLAKSVFQLHIVDEETGEIQRRQIKRTKLTEFFSKCQRSLVAMEACGTSHYWARVTTSFGHEAKLLPAQHVKAFLLRDKTDAMDAQAIWVAAQQPRINQTRLRQDGAATSLHGLARHAPPAHEDARHANQCAARQLGRVLHHSAGVGTTNCLHRSRASWPRHKTMIFYTQIWCSAHRNN